LGKKKCEKWLFFYPEELLVSFNIIYIYMQYIFMDVLISVMP
jgi:hypothetical protein